MKHRVTALALAMVSLVVVPSTAAAQAGAEPPAATTGAEPPDAAAVPAPTAGGPHPVPASFVDGRRAEVQNPLGEHPATNDWDCELTEARPRPVVLVHGTFLNRQDNWAYLAPTLANEGYCVYALTYSAHPQAPWPLSALGGTRTMEEGTVELAAFVDRVRAATGAEKVDLVGHSQGTIMLAVYVNELGGHEYVENYVGLGSVWRGSTAFFLSQAFDLFGQVGIRDEVEHFFRTVGCGACNQVLAGSQFFHDLWRTGTPYHPDVRYTNILTRYDEIVTPFTSGYVEGPNAQNHVVQDYSGRTTPSTSRSSPTRWPVTSCSTRSTRRTRGRWAASSSRGSHRCTADAGGGPAPRVRADGSVPAGPGRRACRRIARPNRHHGRPGRVRLGA